CDETDTLYDMPMLPHVYGAPEWQWQDETHAVAVFRCANCSSEATVEADEITSEVVKAPTKKKSGLTRYTATVTFEGRTYISTAYNKVVPALGYPACPVCGKVHNGSTFLDTLIGEIHWWIYTLKHIFI
ncbi:MAG: hypothetical protein II184_00795, partial [Clostridia bacterium]|nr:hypothetical protein [Clostridia bacterium]